MSNNLTPLTPAEQAEFDRRRESRSVVQFKCAGCGQWYEASKQADSFRESFFCDCGGWITFDVPALDLVIKPTETEMLALDADARLDTGMTAKEAIASASAWWATKGAKLARTELKRQAQSQGQDKGNGGVFASLDPDDPNFIPSGIIHGKPWDELTKRERLQIVKIWHHFHIRQPQTIGDQPS